MRCADGEGDGQVERGADGEGQRAAGIGEAVVVDGDFVLADLEIGEAEAAGGVSRGREVGGDARGRDRGVGNDGPCGVGDPAASEALLMVSCAERQETEMASAKSERRYTSSSWEGGHWRV